MTPSPNVNQASVVRHRGTLRAVPTAGQVTPIRPQVVSTQSKVSLNEISLSYRTNSGERLTALENVSFDVRAGEFLCIVGPSGCGKSTLLHLIAGLNQQTVGSIRVDGKPIQGTDTDRILIFQELGLFPG